MTLHDLWRYRIQVLSVVGPFERTTLMILSIFVVIRSSVEVSEKEKQESIKWRKAIAWGRQCVYGLRCNSSRNFPRQFLDFLLHNFSHDTSLMNMVELTICPLFYLGHSTPGFSACSMNTYRNQIQGQNFSLWARSWPIGFIIHS